MKGNRGAKGGTGCLLMFICWLSESYPPKREKETSSKRKETNPALTRGFELGLWVDSQTNQLVVVTVPDMQFPLSQPPQIPPIMSLSPHFFLNLNTMEFSDIENG